MARIVRGQSEIRSLHRFSLFGPQSTAHAKQWRSYTAQKKAAGEHAGKLLMRLPSNKDRWQDESAGEQIHWIADDKGTGLAFWDAQIESPAWRKREVWSLIQSVRDGK